MERASLRRVPSRPQGPVAPADALSYVTEELRGLDPSALAAFALVALVGRARADVAGSPDADAAAGLAGEALADALTRARKALRRKLYPLPGSGWCERAERLISDRLDDALEDPGPARLEVHLANCERCVEHERRLGQAQDALVARFEKSHPAEEPASDVTPEEPDAEVLPALRVVDTPILAPPASEPEAPPAPDGEAGELTQPKTEQAQPADGEEPAAGAPEEPAAAEPDEPAASSPHTPAAPEAAPAPVQASSGALAPTSATPPAAPAAAAPPVRPPRAAWIAPAPTAPVRPAHWTAPTPPPAPSTSTAPPAPSWPSTPSRYEPAPWSTGLAGDGRSARGALEENVWTSIGPLLAVLSVAVVIFAIAGLLAVG